MLPRMRGPWARLLVGSGGLLLCVCTACGTALPSPVDHPAAGATTSSPTAHPPPGLPVVDGAAEQPWWQATPGGLATPIDQNLTIDGDVLFEPDQATLTPAAASQLSGVAATLRAHPGAWLLIGGHTDVGDGGSEEDAVTLSVQRAMTVGAWFVAQGVSPEHVRTAGYGDTRPAAPSDTSEHRAQNRRCELVITTDGAKAGAFG